mgnify:CR=1 FL=1
MVQHYHSLIYYLSRSKQLKSLLEYDKLIQSGVHGNEYNFNDNYDGYF